MVAFRLAPICEFTCASCVVQPPILVPFRIGVVRQLVDRAPLAILRKDALDQLWTNRATSTFLACSPAGAGSAVTVEVISTSFPEIDAASRVVCYPTSRVQSLLQAGNGARLATCVHCATSHIPPHFFRLRPTNSLT